MELPSPQDIDDLIGGFAAGLVFGIRPRRERRAPVQLAAEPARESQSPRADVRPDRWSVTASGEVRPPADY